MPFDAYLKIDGIPGESRDDQHKDWIQLIAYNHQMTQPASATDNTAGAATSAKVNFGDMIVTKYMDKSSPKLSDACAKGTHIANVMLHAAAQTGAKNTYLEIKMENVVVSSINTDGKSTSSQYPVELVGLKFGKITWTYTQLDRTTGQKQGNVVAGWDLMANKPTS